MDASIIFGGNNQNDFKKPTNNNFINSLENSYTSDESYLCNNNHNFINDNDDEGFIQKPQLNQPNNEHGSMCNIRI